ncbi:MAG: hypothetical protein GF309_02575 [Candidatus Lokiarchaeota archaeon]|nr:hypothetical protein [Candidatus Lokiarchaeota archaeon]
MERLQQKRVLQILNLLAPFIAGAIAMIFGGSSGNWEDVFVDDSLTKLLSPAPITFAIWGPIFFLLGLFYFYQARDLIPGKKEIEMPFIRQVSVFFLLSSVMATVWFVTWAAGMIWASVASMIVYLITILVAYFRLGVNLDERTRKERLFITSGWSMYAGWITVATLVNSTTGLVYTGFENLPFTELQWTIGLGILALVVYLVFLLFRKDYIFAGVGIWAFIGLSITHASPASPSNLTVFVISIAGAVVIAATMLINHYFDITSRLQSAMA